ncbi:MAG TPA: peptidylprolyl isomerase [Chitinophagales bacterium]|nr:peptidylprolyl isomerase [Chitinophagales bacterium]
MNKLFSVVFLSLCLLTVSSFAQNGHTNANGDVLFTIGNDPVTSQEFLNVYKKNSMGKEVDMSESALRDYLNLYVNFRLKVKEAKTMQLDTAASVKSELTNYRSQLAKNYLTDTAKIGQLTREAYNRMQKEVQVQHILVRVDQNASAADSMAAWKKINAIRALVAKGKDFAQVARDSSEDQSAKENGGNLGYITAMQVVYPVENAAYNTPVGKVSAPFRTRFGYHILKVNDVRPSRGTVQVAHIFIKTPQKEDDPGHATAKSKVDDLYAQLMAGGNFDEMVKQHSDDKTTAGEGGKLAPFSTGKMVPEFEEAAFALSKPGDISKPVKTKFGYHIIKLVERTPLAPFKEMQDQLRRQVEKDPRAEEARASFIARLRQDYNMQVNQAAKAEFAGKIDSSLLKGLWTAEAVEGMNNNLVTLTDNKHVHGTRSFTQREFAEFIEKNQRKFMNAGDKDMMIGKMFDQFVENSLIAFEEERLASKYPAFRDLMGEYNDGILLFELTDRKVWSKAVKDTAGLKAFYETAKENYMSDEKARVTVYNAADQTVLETVNKYRAKNWADDKILSKVSKKNKSALSVDYMTVERGKGHEIEQAGWAAGKTLVTKQDDGRVRQMVITGIDAPSPKPLEEVRGYIVADYQEKLEREWIQSLREKYPVKVNEPVLMAMVQK